MELLVVFSPVIAAVSLMGGMTLWYVRLPKPKLNLDHRSYQELL